MSTKSTKTIDDLGINTYRRYEEDRELFDEKFLSDSRNVASQLSTDVFEPMADTEFQLQYELGRRGSPWSLMPPPEFFSRQKKKLFTHQLAPKLGPEDLLEMQIERIEGRKEKEEDERKQKHQAETLPWEAEQDIKQIGIEAKKLIDLMQDISVLNKIMGDINSERYRYKKG